MKRLAVSFLGITLLAAACGHDELWLGSDGGATGGVHAGGMASKPSKPDAAAGASGGGSAGGGGAPSDGASDVVAEADAAGDSDAGGGDGGDGGDGAVAVVPDFSLVDENPASSLYQKKVSPRDYLGQISAWYFGHAT